MLAPWFDTEPGGPATAALAASLVERDAVALVEPGGTATLLHPRADAFAGERDLDSVRLERAVDGVPHVLRYQHGVGNVLAALERGEAQAAVLIRPVSVREIERTAHEGLLMPPEVDLLHAQAPHRPGPPLHGRVNQQARCVPERLLTVHVRRSSHPAIASADMNVAWQRYPTDQVPLDRSSALSSPGPLRSAAAISCWLMPVP